MGSGAYDDSVTLMRAGRRPAGRPGVTAALTVMVATRVCARPIWKYLPGQSLHTGRRPDGSVPARFAERIV